MFDVEINLEKLTKLREEYDYSISQISNLLGYKTATGYWLIEKGERKVSVQVLYTLAKIYNVNMEDLLIVNSQ